MMHKESISPRDSGLKATDPLASVWVSANAGAGKTRLLTNRVLRLLLSGVPPQRILCITYTSAAAAEMKLRIHTELSVWAVVDDAALREKLRQLTGTEADIPTLKRARALFAFVLEAPEGVRIQTIHGFCQSMLRRFPLEAGIQPNFSVIDERTSLELVQEAANRLYLQSEKNIHDAKLSEALNHIAGRLSESSFQSLIHELVQERRHLQSMLYASGGADALEKNIYRALGLQAHQPYEDYLDAAFQYSAQTRMLLAQASELLQQGSGKSEPQNGALLAQWLSFPQQRAALYAAYADIYLTKEGEPRSKLHTKNTITQEAVQNALKEERQRVLLYNQQRKSLHIAEASALMVRIAEGLIALYDAQKNQRAVLDYDDLILTARDLLRTPGAAAWVLYKLDGGIDHILLDEAQDTSPEQWQIITAITEEFFAGYGAREDAQRTLFVVGDEKQSIYSFQGADPEAFVQMRGYFRTRFEDAQKVFYELDLLRSYRSSAPVLQSVDAVFKGSNADAPLKHELTRLGEAGRVELWPLIEPQEREIRAAWELPLSLKQRQQASHRLAELLAESISGWITSARMLASQARPVQPGDIMVLVRRRSTFVDILISQLKRKNIPVAGVDRMVLTNNLAVQDMMALGRFLLLPQDDLNLAGLLRSPMFDFSEEALFALAHGREDSSLWQRLALLAQKHPVYENTLKTLTDWLRKLDYCTPYAFFAHVLEVCRARGRITGRMGLEYNDALDEFLSQSLQYESQHTPSMQGFLHWLERGEAIIKRDMEHGRNEVRILTIHGAKGLQAPIVIMPDTATIPTSKEQLLWLEEKDPAEIMLCPGSTKADNALTRHLRELRARKMLSEYNRLLYVAMTRAEDELYICGYKSAKNAKEDSWYQLVSASLKGIAEPCDTPAGPGVCVHAWQTGPTKTKSPARAKSQALEPVPAYLLQKAQHEQTFPPPLMPSKMAAQPQAKIISPLAGVNIFRRGILIHKMLQTLPQVPVPRRKGVAALLLGKEAPEITGENAARIIHEVMGMLEHPQWGALFLPDGLAEVPVCGHITFQGQQVPVSGQIDRLVVRESEVWILDYKTHRLPPESVEDTPDMYLRQMAVYSALVAEIYEKKTIRSALVWTSVPLFMPIPAEMLRDTVLQSS